MYTAFTTSYSTQKKPRLVHFSFLILQCITLHTSQNIGSHILGSKFIYNKHIDNNAGKAYQSIPSLYCIRNKHYETINNALHILPVCTFDTNIQYLHDQANILPVSHYAYIWKFTNQKLDTNHNISHTHTLTNSTTHRQKKQIVFNHYKYTTHIKTSHLHTPKKTWNAYTLPHALHIRALAR